MLAYLLYIYFIFSQNACPYVMTGVVVVVLAVRHAFQAVVYLEKSLTYNDQILHEPYLQPHRI